MWLHYLNFQSVTFHVLVALFLLWFFTNLHLHYWVYFIMMHCPLLTFQFFIWINYPLHLKFPQYILRFLFFKLMVGLVLYLPTNLHHYNLWILFLIPKVIRSKLVKCILGLDFNLRFLFLIMMNDHYAKESLRKYFSVQVQVQLGMNNSVHFHRREHYSI